MQNNILSFPDISCSIDKADFVIIMLVFCLSISPKKLLKSNFFVISACLDTNHAVQVIKTSSSLHTHDTFSDTYAIHGAHVFEVARVINEMVFAILFVIAVDLAPFAAC
ncbi:MAG: hypothetical protein H7240_02165 [Glaciimonas sp.]|nr:hypothetical protein [Glaciimonas sp.]